jgi:hypothetical protein
MMFHQVKGEFSGSAAKLDDGSGQTKVAQLLQPIEWSLSEPGKPVAPAAGSVVVVPGLPSCQDRAGYSAL